MAEGLATPVSVAIIARDEADRLPACLESLTFSDDVVVVVDQRSRDATLALARSYGCRTISKAWMGYAKQKQFAVDACKNDWVLILDADERVPHQTAESIDGLIVTAGPEVTGFAMLRKNIFHGRWIRHCGWWPDRVVRLVARKSGCFSSHLVHEKWVATGQIKNINLTLEHHSFRNYADLIDKMQNYSTLAAMQMQKEDRRAHWWTSVSHGTWMFMRTYLLELGILEGFDGFMISLLNAGGSFLKYAKLRELKVYRTGDDCDP